MGSEISYYYIFKNKAKNSCKQLEVRGLETFVKLSCLIIYSTDSNIWNTFKTTCQKCKKCCKLMESNNFPCNVVFFKSNCIKVQTLLIFLNVWSFLHQTHINVLATCGQAFKSHSLLWKKWKKPIHVLLPWQLYKESVTIKSAFAYSLRKKIFKPINVLFIYNLTKLHLNTFSNNNLAK